MVIEPVLRLTPWATGHDSLPKREKRHIEGVVVHRIEVSQEDSSFDDSPMEVDRFFREHPIGIKATGGDMPYPILISRDGVPTQTLPLSVCSPHAVSKNPSTIGVGCIGDFRSTPVPTAQWQALIHVCAHLMRDFGLSVQHIYAHDELSGARRDPDKICPGDELDIAALRAALSLYSLDGASPFVW